MCLKIKRVDVSSKKIVGGDLFEYPNVHYDKNSDYRFEDLNEGVFISRVFEELQRLMKETFFDFEFFIFSNHKKKVLPESIQVKSSKKKILLYFSDELGKDPRPYSQHYFAIFKAYIGDRYGSTGNVFPIQIGYVKDVPVFRPIKPIENRKYNVFFRGNLNKNRIDFFRNISGLKWLFPAQRFFRGELYRNLLLKTKVDFSSKFPDSILMFNSSFKSGYTLEKYGEILSESKIVLCPKGYDMTECFRHFEGMRAGCVILSERLPNTEFYRGSPILEIDDWGEGIAIVKKLLANPEQMQRIQKQMIEWWENRCSESATARYVSERIAGLLNAENGNATKD